MTNGDARAFPLLSDDDASDAHDGHGFFDRVLADVPCSGDLRLPPRAAPAPLPPPSLSLLKQARVFVFAHTGHECMHTHDRHTKGDGTLRKAPDLWRRWTRRMGVGLHSLQVPPGFLSLSLSFPVCLSLSLCPPLSVRPPPSDSQVYICVHTYMPLCRWRLDGGASGCSKLEDICVTQPAR